MNIVINEVRKKLANGEMITQQDLTKLAEVVRGSSSNDNRALYVAAKNAAAEAQAAAKEEAPEGEEGNEGGNDQMEKEPTAAELYDEMNGAFNKARSSGHPNDKVAYTEAKRRYNVVKEFEADQQAQAAAQEQQQGEGGGDQ